MAETADPLSADTLRNLATDYARAKRWADLLALEPSLRADREYWTNMWGPACAIARWHQGHGDKADARELLEECVDEGFHDLEPFGTMFRGALTPRPLHYVVR